jgi:mono/diheme cytochrome c family protein
MPGQALWHLQVWTLITAVVLALGLALPRLFHPVLGVGLMAVSLLGFGSYEWFRESARKPYVIQGYMYGNGIEVAQMDRIAQDGMLAHIAFRTGDDGADLYRRACRSCHTVNGYRPLSPALSGTDPEFIAAFLRGIHVARGNMPPFPGTEEEARLLAEHLWKQLDRRPLAEIHGLSGAALGEKVYEVRCGVCHEVGGYNDKTESLAGWGDEEEYLDFLDMAGELADEMPAFTGSDEDRRALAQYLATWKEGE